MHITVNAMPRRIPQMEPWIGQEERNALAEYMDSGGWITEYRRTNEFEGMLADFVGSEYAVVVNNGTVSLAVALMALGLERDDEVIVPDFTMIGSANAVRLAGGKPIFVDVDRLNLCLDLDQARRAVTDKTKVIMYVSLNGRCHDMSLVSEFAAECNVLLLEDAAQSLGSRCHGRHLGTFGKAGSFSFSTPKIITTGQGGAIVTDDKVLYEKILLIKDFGRPKSGVDYHQTLGYNFKFTDVQAVIGIEQIKKLDWRLKRKKEIYKTYVDLLRETPGIEFMETNLEDTAPWFIDIIVPEKRDELAASLSKTGIGARPFYPAIHTQPPYEYVKGRFPNSEYVSMNGLWLPSSTRLTDDDIHWVCHEIDTHMRQSA